MLDRLYLLGDLGMTWCSPGGARGCGWRERSLGLLAQGAHDLSRS